MHTTGLNVGALAAARTGFISLVCNLTITPITLVLLARAAGPAPGAAQGSRPATPRQGTGRVIAGAFESPLVWAPLLGLMVALVGRRPPALLDQSLNLLGASSSGVAIFASGLVLAAHRVQLSRTVWAASAGKMVAEPALLLGLMLLVHARGPTAAGALAGTALPSAVVSVLLAAKYKVAEGAAATTLVVTSVAMVGALPLAVLASSLVR